MDKHKSSPSLYIPTLYFAEGLPYAIVNMMSIVFYKELGTTNHFIGVVTSLFYVPWVAKFIWAPFVDLYGKRHDWIVTSQLMLSIAMVILSASVLLSCKICSSIILFVIIAFISATQDIAIDGYYLDTLDRKGQAAFVGIRNAAYKIAWLFGSGILVFLAGSVSEHFKQVGTAGGWACAFFICALIIGGLCSFHYHILPKKLNDSGVSKNLLEPGRHFYTKVKSNFCRFGRIFLTFFDQPKIFAVLFYILLFRLGDALMLKMAQPFLLDKIEAGGLAISTTNVGLIYGTAGVVSLIVGGIIGGLLVAKFGLKKTLLPTALCQNMAILLYWGLSIYKPSLWWVYVTNSFEQLAYGLGTAAYTVFLLSTVKQEYKAAHYAIATALMAIGLMIPGAISGFLTEWLGYQKFFLLSFLVSLPGVIVIFFLPIKEKEAMLIAA